MQIKDSTIILGTISTQNWIKKIDTSIKDKLNQLIAEHDPKNETQNRARFWFDGQYVYYSNDTSTLNKAETYSFSEFKNKWNPTTS